MACPDPSLIDALARHAPDTLAADPAMVLIAGHVARCSRCAEVLRAERFAMRFGRVLGTTAAPARAEPLEAGARVPDARPAAKSGGAPLLPGYRLLGEISRGAQGVVYEAEQVSTSRRVAVKVLHDTCESSPTSLVRFAREIQIARALSHPGIVRLEDSLTLSDGRDALVMELVRGVSLSQWLEGSPPLSDVVETLARIADALHHAHLRGVIHRDLTPANVMVDERGEPRILDFGVAALMEVGIERRRVTLTGQFAGTLAYAAPEQVAEHRTPPDIRSDIYALGVIAYEAMSGALPYGVHGSLETTLWNVLNAEPAPLRARVRDQVVPRDLAVVIHKALSKEPERRYQTAADFAEDLRRTLHGEAIAARRDSRAYVLRKSVRRHRVAYGFAGAVVAFTLAMVAVLLVSNARLSAALEDSTVERLRTLASSGARAKAEDLLWPRLDEAVPPGADVSRVAWHGSLTQRRYLWAFLELQGRARVVTAASIGTASVADGANPAEAVTFATLADGRVAIIGADGTIRAIDPVTLACTPMGRVAHEGAARVALTPDGRAAISVVGGTLVLSDLTGASAQRVSTDAAPCEPVFAPVVARVDLRDALGDLPSGAAASSGFLIPRLTVGNRSIAVYVPQRGVACYRTSDLALLAVYPDATPMQSPWIDEAGERLAMLMPGGGLWITRVPDAPQHDPIRRAPPGEIREFLPQSAIAASSASGLPSAHLTLDRQLTRVVAMLTNTTWVMDLSDERARAIELPMRIAYRVGANFDPSGQRLLLTAFGDSRLRIFDLVANRELPALTGHETGVMHFWVLPDASAIITIDAAGVVRRWDSPTRSWRLPLSEPTVFTLDMATLDSGRRVAFGRRDQTLGVVPTSPSGTAREPGDASKPALWTGPDRAVVPGRALTVAASSTGGLAFADLSNRVIIVPASRVDGRADGAGERVLTLDASDRVQSLCFGPDGDVLVATLDGDLARVAHDDLRVMVRRGLTPRSSIATIRMMPVDATIVVGARDGTVRLLDGGTLEQRASARASTRQVRAAEPSPDGSMIAAVGDGGVLSILETRRIRETRDNDGAVVASARVSDDSIFAAAFHPSSRTIVVGDRAGVVTVIDVPSLVPLATFQIAGPVTSLAFVDEGATLIVAGIDCAVERWDFDDLLATVEPCRRVRRSTPER